MNIVNRPLISIRSRAAPQIVPLEQAEGQCLTQYVATQPYLRDYFAHVMNEHTSGNPHHGGIKKSEGVSKGFPDYLFERARWGWHGLRIELKRLAGSRHTVEQKTWQRRHLQEGYLHVVAAGWRVAAAWLIWYGANPIGTDSTHRTALPRRLHTVEFPRNENYSLYWDAFGELESLDFTTIEICQ